MKELQRFANLLYQVFGIRASGSDKAAPPDAIQPRIVGGTEATAGTYPYYAHGAGDFLCGGSLIHEDIVLTAAHCRETFEGVTDIFLGATDIIGRNGEESVPIDIIFPHPDYTPGDETNDIMLIKLTGPAQAPVITLNTDPSEPADGQTVTVIGFGKVSEEGDVSQQLLETTVDIVPYDTCVQQITAVPLFENLQVCAGIPEGGRDSCEGDSGGPLFDPATGTQYGLVSFGVGCARPDSAGVYTRVSGYTDWIQTFICDNSGNPPTSCNTPAPTTPAPVATTPAPVAATPAPVAATPAPVAATPAPVAATPAPISATGGPEQSITFPPTPAPVAATAAPIPAPPPPPPTPPTTPTIPSAVPPPSPTGCQLQQRPVFDPNQPAGCPTYPSMPTILPPPIPVPPTMPVPQPVSMPGCPPPGPRPVFDPPAPAYCNP